MDFNSFEGVLGSTHDPINSDLAPLFINWSVLPFRPELKSFSLCPFVLEKHIVAEGGL
jgi:hypothetical protein